ncbi:MAG: ferrous iron transport protein A [Desulfopila sp.]
MKSLRLDQLSTGKMYQISGFEVSQSVYAEKLHKMGFVTGTPVRLAPVALKDPMVIELRGSRIALRRSEASQVLVEEI